MRGRLLSCPEESLAKERVPPLVSPRTTRPDRKPALLSLRVADPPARRTQAISALVLLFVCDGRGCCRGDRGKISEEWWRSRRFRWKQFARMSHESILARSGCRTAKCSITPALGNIGNLLEGVLVNLIGVEPMTFTCHGSLENANYG